MAIVRIGSRPELSKVMLLKRAEQIFQTFAQSEFLLHSSQVSIKSFDYRLRWHRLTHL